MISTDLTSVFLNLTTDNYLSVKGGTYTKANFDAGGSLLSSSIKNTLLKEGCKQAANLVKIGCIGLGSLLSWGTLGPTPINRDINHLDGLVRKKNATYNKGIVSTIRTYY